jgi:hypothetical protein
MTSFIISTPHQMSFYRKNNRIGRLTACMLDDKRGRDILEDLRVDERIIPGIYLKDV